MTYKLLVGAFNIDFLNMEWLDNLIPLIGVAIGWGLAEFSRLWTDKKVDRRKVKRLLYFLLELRFHIARELKLETEITNCINKAKDRLQKDFGENVDFGPYLPLVKEAVSKLMNDDDKIEFLENNIDSIIVELAEIYPVFAYELSGQYKIKDRINRTSQYLNELDEIVNQVPFDLKKWLQPKMSKSLVEELDWNLLRIAKTIGRKTKQEVESKLKKQDSVDEKEFDEYLTDFFSHVKENISK